MTKVLRKEEVIAVLRGRREELVQYHVKFLALFGSVARGDSRADSDLDFLVEFSRPVGMFHMSRFQKFLEGVFHRKIDLVVPEALREEFREQISREMIRAA